MFWFDQVHVFGWIFGVLILIALVVLIVVGITWLVRRRSGESNIRGISQVPLDIARERYAKGDITKEEFEQLKKDLNS